MTKKTLKKNRFDSLIDELTTSFAKIKNFDLLSTDETGKNLFNMVAYRISDLSSYKELVIQHFVPAANKAIFDSEKEIQNSRHKHLLNIKKADLRETLHDTIRLAYVALFHKLEGFINDIYRGADLLDDNRNSESTEKYSNKVFNFNLKKYHLFPITHKINWVCNCVKHYDGFPMKTPKPPAFAKLDENLRIILSEKDFKTDAEELIKFCPALLQLTFMIASHKIANSEFDRDFWKDSPQFIDEHDENEKLMTKLIKDLIVQITDMYNPAL